MCLLYMVGFVCVFEDGLYCNCHIAHSYGSPLFHHSDKIVPSVKKSLVKFCLICRKFTRQG